MANFNKCSDRGISILDVLLLIGDELGVEGTGGESGEGAEVISVNDEDLDNSIQSDDDLNQDGDEDTPDPEFYRQFTYLGLLTVEVLD